MRRRGRRRSWPRSPAAAAQRGKAVLGGVQRRVDLAVAAVVLQNQPGRRPGFMSGHRRAPSAPKLSGVRDDGQSPAVGIGHSAPPAMVDLSSRSSFSPVSVGAGCTVGSSTAFSGHGRACPRPSPSGGLQRTILVTTQRCLPRQRVRLNPCPSNIDIVPLCRNDTETDRSSTASKELPTVPPPRRAISCRAPPSAAEGMPRLHLPSTKKHVIRQSGRIPDRRGTHAGA